MYESSVNGSKDVQDAIKQNNATILRLMERLDVLSPPIVVVEVSKADEAKMNAAMDKLVNSSLPLLGMGIDSPTGTLRVMIDIDRADQYTEAKIKEIATGVNFTFTYHRDTASFQGACNQSTKYCNPLVGGSVGEDGPLGQNCTISIAVVRNTFWGTENGVIIPNHCNQETGLYYQPDNINSSYLVGSQTRDGGWYCDCDFIKSNSRAIDTSKISMGANDITISGKADYRMNDWIVMYGAVSGRDMGQIVEVNARMEFDGNWFYDLYKIRHIDFTDGDSGAPIIGMSGNSHKYAGMNIGVHEGYNYGHDWTFLKYKLGLR